MLPLQSNMVGFFYQLMGFDNIITVFDNIIPVFDNISGGVSQMTIRNIQTGPNHLFF
jgi:hypothetical protein